VSDQPESRVVPDRPMKLWSVPVYATVIVLAPAGEDARGVALAAVGRTDGDDTDDAGHALVRFDADVREASLAELRYEGRTGLPRDVWARDASGAPVLLGTTDTDQTMEHVRRALDGREAA